MSLRQTKKQFKPLCSSSARLRRIIPTIEKVRAIAQAVKRAPKLSKDDIIIINVSGRGNKDVAAIAAA